MTHTKFASEEGETLFWTMTLHNLGLSHPVVLSKNAWNQHQHFLLNLVGSFCVANMSDAKGACWTLICYKVSGQALSRAILILMTLMECDMKKLVYPQLFSDNFKFWNTHTGANERKVFNIIFVEKFVLFLRR